MISTKNKNVYFNDVLTEQEIVNYGTIVADFFDGLCSYKDLRKKFMKYGIEVTPSMQDISKKKMTLDMAKKVIERFGRDEYLPDDIRCFILNGNGVSNVFIWRDINLITVLADNGNMRAKKQLKDSYEFQINYLKKYGFQEHEDYINELTAKSIKLEEDLSGLPRERCY